MASLGTGATTTLGSGKPAKPASQLKAQGANGSSPAPVVYKSDEIFATLKSSVESDPSIANKVRLAAQHDRRACDCARFHRLRPRHVITCDASSRRVLRAERSTGAARQPCDRREWVVSFQCCLLTQTRVLFVLCNTRSTPSWPTTSPTESRAKPGRSASRRAREPCTRARQRTARRPMSPSTWVRIEQTTTTPEHTNPCARLSLSARQCEFDGAALRRAALRLSRMVSLFCCSFLSPAVFVWSHSRRRLLRPRFGQGQRLWTLHEGQTQDEGVSQGQQELPRASCARVAAGVMRILF